MRKLIFVILVPLFLGPSGCRTLPFESQILSYDGNKVAKTFIFDGSSLASEGAGQWNVDVDKSKISSEATDYALTFTMKEGEMASGGAAVQFEFDGWSTDNYIFAPCHLYDGNRFRIMRIGYAPFIYNPEDRHLDMPITVTNVPHFNQDGSDATVDFRTNSCATPLAGFYDKEGKRGFFILTEQNTELCDNAFFISEFPFQKRLTIRLSAPGVREHRYTMCNADRPSDDEGIALKAGDEIKLLFRVYDFPCEDLMAYFDKFFSVRKDLSGENEMRNIQPFSSVEDVIFAHHFEDKWYEDKERGYVCNKPYGDSYYGHLQLGWNGAPVYSLMQLSGKRHPDYDEILRRVSLTFDSIEYMQRESGLFNAIMMRGEYIGDSFRESRKERDVAMIRRTALTIYYGLQCLDMLRLQGHEDMIKPSWEETLRKASDALCTLYGHYGEFGQEVYACSGEMHTPNSTQGALCIGALAYASKYFSKPKYLELAKKSGESYYQRFIAKGYSGGGPGEILQAPDSESNAEMVESYTALFEMTRDERWLKYARDAAAMFSSWVISYDYDFPEGSGMKNAGIKSTGAVWASVQNEHGAPGIYVMSGDFLLKLYRATGDKRYLELDKDISHNVIQYVNTPVNKVQEHGGPGYCTERVNIGDWEGSKGIGALADNDSNQAWENVALYHMIQNPGIYVETDTGEVTVFDHVEARLADGALEITNPTPCDAVVSVLAESTAQARGSSLGWLSYYNWPVVSVPAGQTVSFTLPSNTQ